MSNQEPLENEFSGTSAEAEMEARLWEYIDGLSTERTRIEALIQDNAEWKAKYGELLAVHTLLHQSELEQPSMRFAKNVMEEIARQQIAPAASTYINKRLIGGLSAFFLLSILGFVVYSFAQPGGDAPVPSKVGDAFADLEAWDWSRPFNNSFVFYFMMLNVVLSLLLLDRALSERNKKLRNRLS